MARQHAVAYGLFIASMSLSIACHAATRYQASEIIESYIWPDVISSYSLMYRINNAGQIYGNDRNTEGMYRGFVWQNSTKTYLETPDGYSSVATGINESGDATGYVKNQGSSGVVWHNGSLHFLPTPSSGEWCMATALNDNGQIVGAWTEEYDGNKDRPVLWNGDNSIELEVGEYSNGIAHSVNNDGIVVGWAEYEFDFGYSTSVWQCATVWQDGVANPLLELNERGPSVAYDINNNGQVVGSRTAAYGCDGAFIWQDGQFIDLPGIGDTPSYCAYGINKIGHVVGTTGSIAISWENGIAYDLKSLLVDDPGWRLSTACDINDLGQILAWGIIGEGDDAQAGLVILTPVPVSEPSSIFALLCGLGSIGVLWYRKSSSVNNNHLQKLII